MSTIIKVLSLAITLLPSAVLAEQFTPQQMLDVMTKSPNNRDVRVHDAQFEGLGTDWGCMSGDGCLGDDNGAY